MDIVIESPTKALVSDISSEDIQKLSKILTYTNTSIAFQLNIHLRICSWQSGEVYKEHGQHWVHVK